MKDFILILETFALVGIIITGIYIFAITYIMWERIIHYENIRYRYIRQ